MTATILSYFIGMAIGAALLLLGILIVSLEEDK